MPWTLLYTFSLCPLFPPEEAPVCDEPELPPEFNEGVLDPVKAACVISIANELYNVC